MIYNIMQRIEAEELCLDASEVIITSTKQEIKEQWKLYDGFDLILARKLRARIKRCDSCYDQYMPRMVVSTLYLIELASSFFLNTISSFVLLCGFINILTHAANTTRYGV